VTARTSTPYSTGFPVVAYESVQKRMGPYQPKHPDLYSHYAGGWNAVQFRSIGCEACMAEYTKLFAQHGAAPGTPVRSAQENALYGFFSYAQSTIESWFFAVHAVGAMATPSTFPMATTADLRKVNPNVVLQRFASTYPSAPITKAMQATLSDPTYLEWKTLRNVLQHRVAPGRHHFWPPRATPPDADWVGTNIILNQDTLSSLYPWLMATVEILLKACDSYTAQRF
jgi:hypothetical protein